MTGSRATVSVGLIVVALATMWVLLHADAARAPLPRASPTAAPLPAATGPDSAPASGASPDHPTRPPTITPSTRPTEPATLTVRGRIVDATRHPVDAAPVRLWQNGTILGETTSGQDGSFEMIADAIKPMALERTATLLAGNTDLDCGRFDIWIRTATPTPVVDTGIIALTDKLIRTTIHVTRDDHDAAAIPVSIPPYFRGITNPEGNVSVDLPPGRRVVIAGNTPDAIAVCPFDPATEPTLGVKLEPARSFTIVVRDAVTELPIPGARIEVDLGDPHDGVPYVADATAAPISRVNFDDLVVQDAAFDVRWRPIATLPLLSECEPPHTTDADGRAVFPSGADSMRISVSVTPPPGRHWRARVRSEQSTVGQELVIHLESLPADGLAHWPIAAGSPIVPPDGTGGRIEATGGWPFDDGSPFDCSCSPAVVRSGELWAAFPCIRMASAFGDSAQDQRPFGKVIMPDGMIALLSAPTNGRGAPVRFEHGRHVNVRIVDFTPAMVGALVARLSEDSTGRVVDGPVPPTGVVEFDGLAAGRHGLYLVSTDPDRSGSRQLGIYDLAAADGTLDVMVGSVVTVTFDVTVNGNPGIPGGLRLSGQNPILHRDEDPAQGRITIRAIGSPGPCSFNFSEPTSGFRTVVDVDPTSERNPIAVAIWTNTAIIASGVGPSSTPTGLRLNSNIQIVDDAIPTGQVLPLNEDMTHWEKTWKGLPLGTYRVIEGRTGTTSEPVTITATAPVGTVHFDLTHSDAQQVRLILPRGLDEGVHGAVALRLEPSVSAFRQPNAGEESGAAIRCLVELPGDRPVTLTPVHQYLHPAPVGGRATVMTPGDDIQLTMEWNQRAFLRLKPDMHLTSPSRVGWALVHDDGDLTRWSASFDVFSDGDRLWFSGFKPGVFTLTLDLWGRAPLRIDAADLTGSGDVDLGVVPFEPAAGALRVTVAGRPKGLAGDLFMRLIADDRRVPVIEQRIAADEPELFLAELALGKWHVTIVPGGQWVDTCRPEDKVEADVTINAGQETGITYPR